MATLNANTPYVECFIRKEYTGHADHLSGYIFGVKSWLNRPLHFHFLSKIGAVFVDSGRKNSSEDNWSQLEAIDEEKFATLSHKKTGFA